jgi:hypothetical protein
MPATTKRSSSKATTQKTTKKEAEPAPVEEVAAPEVTDAVEQSATEVSPLQAEAANLIEMARACQNMLQNLIKGTRTTAANIRKLERDVRRLDKRNRRNRENRASNGNKGLQQLKPVYTPEMRTFFENNQSLTDGEGSQIVENLTYDSDHLLVSRKQALKLVTSYIRQNNLQDQENKRRINMDATLQGLFPELCAVKDKKGKVVQEENCYYNTLMKALSRHFTATD